jgi:hypothetical protein
MHGVCNCAPEANHASRVRNVTAILVTIYGTCNVLPVLNVVYLHISTLRSMCAVPNMEIIIIIIIIIIINAVAAAAVGI